MKYEINDQACNLDMPNGMHGIKYEQKFVKAKSEHPYPCNYEAEKVNHARVMKETLGHK